MNLIRSILILTFALAGFSRGETEKKKVVDVASLKPRDLVEFDKQPETIRAILAYGLSLTEKKLGYQYGSCDPAKGGMDCSGTIYHILEHQGLNPPRSSHTIYLWVREKGNLTEVKGATRLTDKRFKALRPGDLLFWEGTYNVGSRFPPTSHVMIFAGHQKSDGRPVAIGASSGRSYGGRARHGVSVFDFQLPRKGSKSKFVGYGPVPGIRNLGIQLPPLKKPEPKSDPVAETRPRSTLSIPVVSQANPGGSATSPVFSPKVGQNPAVTRAVDANTGEPWRYLVYLPERYGKSEESFPMILYLHGRSIRGRDLNAVKRYGPPALLDGQPDFPFVVVSPQLPDGSWPSDSLLVFLDEILETYRIDPDRVCLTGVSMGAGGAWRLAGTKPERFAAFAPVCNYGDMSLAPRLVSLPTWGFHGAKDDTISIEPHKKLLAAINQGGGAAHLSIFPEGDHGNIIMQVYRMESLYDWFLAQKHGQPPVPPKGKQPRLP